MSEQEQAKQEFLRKLKELREQQATYEAEQLAKKLDEAYKQQQEKKQHPSEREPEGGEP